MAIIQLQSLGQKSPVPASDPLQINGQPNSVVLIEQLYVVNYSATDSALIDIYFDDSGLTANNDSNIASNIFVAAGSRTKVDLVLPIQNGGRATFNYQAASTCVTFHAVGEVLDLNELRNFKELGQVRPAAATPTVLTNADPVTMLVGLWLNISNIEVTPGTFSVWYDPDGTQATNNEIIIKDEPIAAKQFISERLILPLTEGGGGRITVESSNGNTTFTLIGEELKAGVI